jgi:DNA-directed RNA polymerase subunit RPC12/RpoP
MPFCLQCGYKIPDEDRFCAKCGTEALKPDEAADDRVETCDACGGRLRQARLYSDQELTIVLNDTEEERFVDALVCGTCGRTQLIVDFETDVER